MTNTRNSWDGEQWSRPLVLLKKVSVEELCRRQNYIIPENIKNLLPFPQVSGEMFLLILVHSGKIPEAVELLSHLITPRVGVWWAIRCYRTVMDDIKKDFEKDGLTPAERRKKKALNIVAELKDTSEIDQMINKHQEAAKTLREDAEEMVKQFEPIAPTDVIKQKVQDLLNTMQQLGLSPEERHPTPQDLQVRNKLNEWLTARLDEKMGFLNKATHPLPPELAEINGDSIAAKIREKTGSIKPTVEAELKKHFPLNIKGLPTLPSQEKKEEALKAAQRWLLVPSDSNGRLACDAAIAAKTGPECLLAYSAFWSSSNMVTETGQIPTNPALAPLGISKTLYLLAMLEGGEKNYDERYMEFLEIGIDCADSTSTWDVFGNEVRTDQTSIIKAPQNSVLTQRSGFGRT